MARTMAARPLTWDMRMRVRGVGDPAASKCMGDTAHRRERNTRGGVKGVLSSGVGPR